MDIKVQGAMLIIDGREMKTADLSQEFLDTVVSESLQGNVAYELEGDHPLAKFFQTLQDETKAGSALRQKMDEMELARAANEVEDDDDMQEHVGAADDRSSQQ